MGFLLVFVLKQTQTILAGANMLSGRSCLWGISISLFSDVYCVICFVIFLGAPKKLFFSSMLDTTISWFRQNEFSLSKVPGQELKPLAERAEILKKLQKSVPMPSVWF